MGPSPNPVHSGNFSAHSSHFDDDKHRIVMVSIGLENATSNVELEPLNLIKIEIGTSKGGNRILNLLVLDKLFGVHVVCI